MFIRSGISLLVLLMLVFTTKLSATHIKAGDISARRTSSTTASYEFILTVYTDSTSTVDDPTATLDFGDATNQTVNRLSKTSVGNATWRNVYMFSHTFTGAGFFRVGYVEYNRVAGVKNMQQSVNTAFYLESVVAIDPFLGVNNSPVLLVPPIDQATVGQTYLHNPGAYDPDGDSLSYKLVTPRQSSSLAVLGYVHPNQVSGTGTFTLNPITGDLEWDAPAIPGIYNIAIMVEEWSGGVRVGYVIRDMQIVVRDINNQAPVLNIPDDTCVVAGATLNLSVEALDADLDQVMIYATGGAFLDPPYISAPTATFTPPNGTIQNVPAYATFHWQPGCDHVRAQPYDVLFKVEDVRPTSEKLFDLESWQIKVYGPAITNVVTTTLSNGIQLNWDPYTCSNAMKIRIYRSDCNATGFVPRPCEVTIPSAYHLVGEVNGSAVTFTDDNNGSGLIKGVSYCYILQAVFPFPGGGISRPTSEVCAGFGLSAPVLMTTTVDVTSATAGEITLNWYAPIDPIVPGPFTYEVYRTTGLNGSTYSLITTVTDTFYTDLNLDTKNSIYRYKIVAVQGTATSDAAASIALQATPSNAAATVTWTTNVPWQTDSVYVYHQVNNGPWVLVHEGLTSITGSYKDIGLQNCDTMRYKVLITGKYCDIRLSAPIRNWSSIVPTVPKNYDPPAAPVLAVDGCNGNLSIYDNVLSWNSVDDANCPVIASYNIYYTEYDDEPYGLLKNVAGSPYVDTDSISLAGCYRVSAVNIQGVEGAKSNVVCVDNCVYYELPNLITPGGDSLNDVFRPLRGLRGVKTVHLYVYNRWGQLVHEQDGNPLLNWNAHASDYVVSDGMYYFLADITYYHRLNRSDEEREIKSWLHIVTEQTPNAGP